MRLFSGERHARHGEAAAHRGAQAAGGTQVAAQGAAGETHEGWGEGKLGFGC